MIDLGLPDLRAFTQPVSNEPESIDRAFREMIAADDEQSSDRAYHRVLYAVGNDHAGTYYSIALAIIPTLGAILRGGGEWAQRTALEVLIDLYSSFHPEPGHERFEDDSLEAMVKHAILTLSPEVDSLTELDSVAQKSALQLREELGVPRPDPWSRGAAS